MFESQMENNMVEQKKEIWVKVKDSAGNEFICPISALKHRDSATEEELSNCVDDGVVGRYAGNLDIEE